MDRLNTADTAAAVLTASAGCSCLLYRHSQLLTRLSPPSILSVSIFQSTGRHFSFSPNCRPETVPLFINCQTTDFNYWLSWFFVPSNQVCSLAIRKLFYQLDGSGKWREESQWYQRCFNLSKSRCCRRRCETTLCVTKYVSACDISKCNFLGRETEWEWADWRKR